jgi:DNA modification methylase
MMWLHSVPCLSCVLGLREEEEEEEEVDLKSMTPPYSLATKVKGGKCLSLEHNGVLQVVVILTA